MSQGRSSVLAVVFDFDDTLVPDSTTAFLRHHKIDPKRFWLEDLKALIDSGYDQTLGFLKIFLDNVGAGKPFGELTNADLRAFGKRLDDSLFPGLKTFFSDLRKEVTKFADISIEFYIVSGGLKEMIAGTRLATEMRAIYGCEFAEGGSPPRIQHIKRAISFTEKTRYLFEISKGIPPEKALTNPLLVNEASPEEERRIPFRNMFYIGDGLTDIPCFSLVKKQGGVAWGVFNAADQSSAKKALLQLLQPGRVSNLNQPRYGRLEDLGSLLRSVVIARCTNIMGERRSAL